MQKMCLTLIAFENPLLSARPSAFTNIGRFDGTAVLSIKTAVSLTQSVVLDTFFTVQISEYLKSNQRSKVVCGFRKITLFSRKSRTS